MSSSSRRPPRTEANKQGSNTKSTSTSTPSFSAKRCQECERLYTPRSHAQKFCSTHCSTGKHFLKHSLVDKIYEPVITIHAVDENDDPSVLLNKKLKLYKRTRSVNYRYLQYDAQFATTTQQQDVIFEEHSYAKSIFLKETASRHQKQDTNVHLDCRSTVSSPSQNTSTFNIAGPSRASIIAIEFPHKDLLLDENDASKITLSADTQLSAVTEPTRFEGRKNSQSICEEEDENEKNVCLKSDNQSIETLLRPADSGRNINIETECLIPSHSFVSTEVGEEILPQNHQSSNYSESLCHDQIAPTLPLELVQRALLSDTSPVPTDDELWTELSTMEELEDLGTRIKIDRDILATKMKSQNSLILEIKRILTNFKNCIEKRNRLFSKSKIANANVHRAQLNLQALTSQIINLRRYGKLSASLSDKDFMDILSSKIMEASVAKEELKCCITVQTDAQRSLFAAKEELKAGKEAYRKAWMKIKQEESEISLLKFRSTSNEAQLTRNYLYYSD